MTLSLTRLVYLANRKFPKTLLLAIVGASSIWSILPIAPQAVAFTLTPTNTEISEKTGFEHESIDLISDVLYIRPESTYRDMAASGAYRVNQDYDLGLRDEWYIEEQRFGADALISGLLHNDQPAIDAGFKMFDWGFTQQLEDGSFDNTGDAFHSTSLFVQSVAYALLTLQESPVGNQYTDAIENYIPQLHNAARWMIQENVWEQGLVHTAPYTHRYYILGAALGLTGKLTNDPELTDYANQVITIGLEQQRSDGVNPELGGHDSSYQVSGALYAMRWLTHFATDPLAPDVANMLDQALLWEDSIILETGAVDTEGNTRTDGQSLARTGEPKELNHREVIYGFAYWFSMTEESLWESNAIQVANYYYADDQLVRLNLDQISNSKPDPISSISSEADKSSQTVPESSFPLGIIIAGTLCFLCMHKPFRF